jgi:hypothetical protein
MNPPPVTEKTHRKMRVYLFSGCQCTASALHRIWTRALRCLEGIVFGIPIFLFDFVRTPSPIITGFDQAIPV